MRVVTCAQCGEEFEAKRSTAKFCGTRCRQQSRRAMPRKRDEHQATDDAATDEGLPRILVVTRTEVERLKKTDTVLGQQALELAARLASPKDTGSAIAAVSRELDRVMLRLQSGAAKAEDQLAAARRRRDEKRRAAAEAREA